MVSSKLSTFQHEVLDVFFREPSSFFLTGGGALGGFHLGHRGTDDLDLFSPPGEPMELAVQHLQRTAAFLGATSESLLLAPEFRRFALARAAETTLVDLVIDRAPQVVPVKERVGAIRIDPTREIAANKVAALLGRTAPRDLVDLFALFELGHELETVLLDARIKDTGIDPGTLSWVLSQWRIGPQVPLPEGVSLEHIERLRLDLIERLLRLAAPKS